MKIRFGTLLGVMAVASAVVLTGCQKTAEGVAEDTGRAVEATDKAVEKTGEAVEEGVEKTGNVVKNAGQAAGDAVEGAGLGAKVKTAILGSKMNLANVDVDATPDGEGVYLRGTVKTAAEKKEAERLAKFTAKDKKVINEIKVQP